MMICINKYAHAFDSDNNISVVRFAGFGEEGVMHISIMWRLPEDTCFQHRTRET